MRSPRLQRRRTVRPDRAGQPDRATRPARAARPDRFARSSCSARRTAALAAIALVALASGCGSSARDLTVVARLADLLDPERPPGTLAECNAGAELRPSLGCLVPVEIARLPVGAPAGGRLTVDVPVPEALHDRPAAIQARLRTSGDEPIGEASAAAVPRGAATVSIAIALPPGVVPPANAHVSAIGVALPEPVQRFTTRPLAIPLGAELDVGIGFDPIAARAGAAPVEVTIAVELPGERRELLRETIDPMSAAAAWSDRRIALRALAGRTARFVFESRAVADASRGGDPGFAAPLWGSPLILAPSSAGGARNVVLISLDTLRGDFVGGTLDGRALTPEIDRLAERGTTFERAWAAYPSTTASHMSMLTGVYPVVHGVGIGRSAPDPRIGSLPSLLAARGYVTAAVTEDALLFSGAFAPGFDFYREFKGAKPLECAGEIEATFAAGVHWLESHPRERFFLFLHTYQVHEPYTPPPDYDLWKTWSHDGAIVPIDGDTPAYVRDRALYAGEARYTDAIVRRLFDELDRLGVMDDSIVVLTADHGEEFNEHGGRSHTRTVYEELLHVPLLVIAPGLVPAGRRIAEPVSLIDLVPTLLAMLGIEPSASAQGTSLAGLLRGDPFPADRALFAERGPLVDARRLVAARRGDRKWIFQSNRDGAREIYDLAADPGEQRPIDDPALREAGAPLWEAHRAMRATADAARHAEGEPALSGAVPSNADEDTASKLRALGYLE